jgi:hypothetical protein
MKINDKKLYLWFVIVTFVVGAIIGSISMYSIMVVEPKAKALLEEGLNINAAETATDEEKNQATISASEKITKAYVMLRSPQLFARYENFDLTSQRITIIISKIDQAVASGATLVKGYVPYIELLLDRRKEGSRLGFNTMVFFFVISAIGGGFLLWEIRLLKKASAPSAARSE